MHSFLGLSDRRLQTNSNEGALCTLGIKITLVREKGSLLSLRSLDTCAVTGGVLASSA